MRSLVGGLTIWLSWVAVGAANEPGVVYPSAPPQGYVLVPYSAYPAPYGYAPVMPTRQVVYVEGQAPTGAPVHRFKWLLNRHGMACSATHNDLQCTNFWSDFRFIFGSCRTFFGQGCVPNEPHHHKNYPTRP